MKSHGFPLLAALLLFCCVPYLSQAREKTTAWPVEVEKALTRAGENRQELEKALTAVPADQRKGMIFLIANMPETDLRALKADFLLENVELAYKVRKQVPWGLKVPEELFLNDVLPYANVDEARHAWRKELYELCLPLVKDCKTAAEAAQVLNSSLFAKLKVKYSTQRKLPNQSPKESIEQGLASCTGLSIILSDACRSVGIPARLVGTPLWANLRGNHTWVELWDDGWHFTGACEADPKGLDRGWFVGDAAQAKKDSPQHAIYAASFRKTELAFPLVWAPNHKDVPAENVTDRYTKTETPVKAGLEPEQLQQIEKEALAFFGATEEQRAKWSFGEKFDQWLASHEEAVRQAVWKAYQTAPIHEKAKKDFEEKLVRSQDHVSPYTVKQVGKRPKNGWPLVIAMHGGGGLPDRDKIKELYPFTRTTVPRHLTWEPTDSVLNDFFWLSVTHAAKGQSLDATVRDNAVQITTKNVKQFTLNLDGRLIAFDKPLRVTLDGTTQVVKVRPQFVTLCQSLLRRGDPALAYTCQISLNGEKK